MKLSDITPRPEKVPADWKTARAWGLKWKLQERQASRILRAALQTGQVRCKKFRVYNGVSIPDRDLPDLCLVKQRFFWYQRTCPLPVLPPPEENG